MDWAEPGSGYLGIDLVAHGSGAVSGAFIHSLVATDISSGVDRGRSAAGS